MSTISQDTSNCKPIIIGELPLKRGEIIRVHLELYRGKWTFHLRKWYRDEHGELQPGKGFSCPPEHLSWLGTALDEALTAARENGLIAANEGSAQ